jgi:uncharacterized protein YggL (DUF469 family)
MRYLWQKYLAKSLFGTMLCADKCLLSCWGKKMKLEAKNRSRRLRKKMRVDEFQELGFDLAWKFADGTSNEQIDQFLDTLFSEVIEPNGLGFGGEGDLLWHGLICTQKLGKCTEEHRQLVESWFKGKQIDSIKVSPLYDVWWAE